MVPQLATPSKPQMESVIVISDRVWTDLGDRQIINHSKHMFVTSIDQITLPFGWLLNPEMSAKQSAKRRIYLIYKKLWNID